MAKCPFIIKTKKLTSTMRYHLQHKHGHKLEESGSISNTPEACSSSSNKDKGRHLSIVDALKKNPNPDMVLARLGAVNRIPFLTSATSQDIKEGLRARGLETPESRTGIRNAIMALGESVKSSLTNDLKVRKEEGEKFSLSLDEYTSGQNRRYMCLNLHTSQEGKHFGLGMIRVEGSMPSEKGVVLVKSKLADFDLDLGDIFGIVTDGAAVMRKMGRLLGTFQQLCMPCAWSSSSCC
jgi:hypothetical protein